MKNNKLESTWEIFCDILPKYAVKRDDFIVLPTESIKKTALLKNLPKDKVFAPIVGEFNLVNNAAGLALAGKRPWIISDTFSSFLWTYKQIRDALTIAPFPVTLVIINGGLSGGDEGVSHNILQDVALMRLLSNMNVFVPSDKDTLVSVVESCISSPFPSFLRLSNEKYTILEDTLIEPSNSSGARIIKHGTDVTIFTCGTMVSEALEAVDTLEKQGISIEIIDCYSIKPFPEQQLLSSVRKTGCCVVAEEHNLVGGLCSAVSECLCRTYPIPVRFVAVDDQYVNSGHPEELREYYGLTWKEIVNAASQVWALRRR
ncbi:MAG: transketolase [Synergistaceae bacterium]|nr:transketolase [Synergistaceae bacterium]